MQEKYDEAMALCWRAFEIYEEILGPHDQAVAGSLHQMVNVLIEQVRGSKLSKGGCISCIHITCPIAAQQSAFKKC